MELSTIFVKERSINNIINQLNIIDLSNKDSIKNIIKSYNSIKINFRHLMCKSCTDVIEFIYINYDLNSIVRDFEKALIHLKILNYTVDKKKNKNITITEGYENILKALKEYNHKEFSLSIKTKQKLCECGETLETYTASKNILICQGCSAITLNTADILDLSDVVVKPSFDPYSHFEYWWIHIIGQEPESEVSPEFIKSMKLYFKTQRIDIFAITPERVRQAIQTFKQPNYLKNVTLIHKLITKINPPVVDEESRVTIHNFFSKTLSHKIEGTGQNRPYYPYYIYKIIEMLDLNDQIKRLLLYIHIQSDSTISRYDDSWQKICKENGFAFKRTNISYRDQFYLTDYI
jgi:hypothetical protein